MIWTLICSFLGRDQEITDFKVIILEEEGNVLFIFFERENGQKSYAFMMIISVILVNQKLRLPWKLWLSSLRRLLLSQDMANAMFTKVVNVIIVHLQKISFRYSLINQGFGVTVLDLKADTVATDIADNIDIIVIADVREAYTPDEIAKIQRLWR